MKELPNKWCCRITKENSNVLESWRIKQPNVSADKYTCINSNMNYLVSDEWSDNTYISYLSNLPSHGEYIEISFEDFKEHVLKEPINMKEKPKSLVGRYIKTLIDHPDSGAVKKGEYGKIISDGLCADFPSQKGYCIRANWKDSGAYELMPEGFDPEIVDISDQLRPYIGKWINFIYDYKEYYKEYSIYFKVLKVENNSIYFDNGYLDTNREYHKDCILLYTLGITKFTILEVNPLTLKEYLPKDHPDIENSIMMKYSIGQIVKFKVGKEDKRINNWITDPYIPRDKLKHGDIYFKENKGVIVDIYDKYYLVSYMDRYDKEVILGFGEDLIEPLYIAKVDPYQDLFEIPDDWYIGCKTHKEFDIWKEWWFIKEPNKRSIHQHAVAYTFPYYCGIERGGRITYNNIPSFSDNCISFAQFEQYILKSLNRYENLIKLSYDETNIKVKRPPSLKIGKLDNEVNIKVKVEQTIKL